MSNFINDILIGIKLETKCFCVNRKIMCFFELRFWRKEGIGSVKSRIQKQPDFLLIECDLTKAESETLTHNIKHGYLYPRYVPKHKLEAAHCEISNQPMCS